jgi:hypothetical protein
MSLIKAIRHQLGLSITPANNFVLTAQADNGTMKLARGNADATTQDIMTVDAAGKVTFPAGLVDGTVKQGDLASDALGAALVSAEGYQKLPSGLIIQWGTVTGGNPATAETFPIPFPTACFSVTHACINAAGNTLIMGVINGITASGFTFSGYAAAGGNPLTANNGVTLRWIAIGY